MSLIALILKSSEIWKISVENKMRTFTLTKCELFRVLFDGMVFQSLEDLNKQSYKQFNTFFMQQEVKLNIDIGLIIRQKMSEQGTSIAWLARQINYDRSNLGKQLQSRQIYPDLLLKISIALKTDFFDYYTQCFRKVVK